MINVVTLRHMSQLLDLHDSDTITTNLNTPSDVKLLLDFVLNVCIISLRYNILNTLLVQSLHKGILSHSGVQDVNRKARSLMFKLIDKNLMMPKSLFITDIPFKSHLDPVLVAQIGSVFKCDHKGKHVVLKLVYKGHKNVSFLPNLDSNTNSPRNWLLRT